MTQREKLVFGSLMCQNTINKFKRIPYGHSFVSNERLSEDDLFQATLVSSLEYVKPSDNNLDNAISMKSSKHT